MVYYLYVKKIPIEDIKHIIQYKDGNGWNIHLSNLTLSTNSIKMKNMVPNGRTPRVQKVTQFSLDVKKVKTYNSMNEAAVAINGHSSRIYTVLDKWPHYYKGYLWRKGDRKKTVCLVYSNYLPFWYEIIYDFVSGSLHMVISETNEDISAL